MENVMRTIEDLLMIEAIQSVKARYCRLLDTKNMDAFLDLFTVDAIMDVTEDSGQPPVVGRQAIRKQVLLAVEFAATCHQVHTPEIELLGTDRAMGVWAMQDRVVWQPGKSPIPNVSGITGYGQYHEEYSLEDGKWRIARLRLSRFHLDMDPA
jgi:hypothetical protein